MVLSMLVGQHLHNQPIDEFMAILDGCLAEAQVLSDLDAVILDRSARPLVARTEFGRHAHLVGEVNDCRAR